LSRFCGSYREPIWIVAADVEPLADPDPPDDPDADPDPEPDPEPHPARARARATAAPTNADLRLFTKDSWGREGTPNGPPIV
jgi:hypothetical protein